MPILVSAQKKLVLTNEQQSYEVTEALYFYEDKSNSLSIDEILSPSAYIQFEKVDSSRTPNFGLIGHTLWLRIVVSNRSAESNWFLKLASPAIQDIRCYTVLNGQIIDQQFSGQHNAFSKSKLNTIEPTLALQFPWRRTSVVYMRIRSSTVLLLPFSMHNLPSFIEEHNADKNVTIVLLGMVLAAFLFNLVIFLFVRERSYFFLSFGLLFLAMHFFFQNGLINEYDLALDIGLKSRMRFVGFQLGSIFILEFTKDYLNLKENHRLSYYIIWGIMAFMLVYMAYTLMPSSSIFFINSISDFVLLVGTLVLMIIGAVLLGKAHYEATTFLYAYAVYALGTLFFLAMLKGYVDYNFFLQRILIACTVVYGTILSYGLTVKINRAKKEKERMIFAESLNAQLTREMASRKVAEEELKELNASKDKFLSIVAHDLKNPFNVILGFGTLLQESQNYYNPEKVIEFSKLIVQSAENAFNLLQELLTWSRAQNDTLKISPETVDPRFVIESAIEIVSPMALQKKIKIKSDLPRDCFSDIDPQMIETVVRNLISNAVKFTEEGGKVWVKLVEHDFSIEIHIRDNGIGMTEEQRKRLFTLDNESRAGTNQETGTGLGLLICKEFVDLHKGDIEVKSELEKGSEFIITLPKVMANRQNQPR